MCFVVFITLNIIILQYQEDMMRHQRFVARAKAHIDNKEPKSLNNKFARSKEKHLQRNRRREIYEENKYVNWNSAPRRRRQSSQSVVGPRRNTLYYSRLCIHEEKANASTLFSNYKTRFILPINVEKKATRGEDDHSEVRQSSCGLYGVLSRQAPQEHKVLEEYQEEY